MWKKNVGTKREQVQISWGGACVWCVCRGGGQQDCSRLSKGRAEMRTDGWRGHRPRKSCRPQPLSSECKEPLDGLEE